MKLKIQDIGKTFVGRGRSVVALESISMTVESGEFLSFLGPSGCGKSTLLNIIGGLEPATEGAVILDDQIVTKPTADIGMVFQHYTLFPWLTVLENACFADRLASNQSTGNTNGSHSRDIRKRAHQLLELTGLDGFQDAYPKELSGGMQQRVAIVRALANRPKVLLMDEPFGALDSQTREEMQEMLLLLSRVEKITVIFVTHDIEEAIFLSDRILVLSHRPGRLTREERIPFGSERSPSLKLTEPFWELKRSLVEYLHDGQPPSFAREKLLEALHDQS